MNFLPDTIPDKTSPGFRNWPVRPVLVCTDGASMSVQASAFHYCTPRDNIGPYTKVEVGFPSAPFPTGAEYKEDPEANDSDSVFGYVPVEIVSDWLESHGGIDYAKINTSCK